MIKFTNNTKKVRENKKEILAANSILNEQMNNLIKAIKSRIESISSEHDAEVTLSGEITDFNLIIESESDETSKIIRDLIKNHQN
jgi:predicted transcriptional regulator